MVNHQLLSVSALRVISLLTTLLLNVGLCQSLAASPNEEQLQALQAALPGKLINDPTRLDWDVNGQGAGKKGVMAPEIPGGRALHLDIPSAGRTAYDINANVPITTAIAVGAKLVVAFYARTLHADTPDGKGKIGVRFQENVAPYAGFGDATVDVGSEWKLYEVAATADKAIASGQAVVGFQLSAVRQVVEIGQTIVVDGASSIVAKAPPAPAKADLLPQLVGQGTLINDLSQQDWKIYGAGETHKDVPAKGMPSTAAVQIAVSNVGVNPYDIVLSVPITEAIKSGDTIMLAVLARVVTAETTDGVGKLGIRVQKNAEPYPGFGDHVLDIGPTWRLYQIKTHANIDIDKGQGSVSVQLAAVKQTVEIDRIYVLSTSAP